MRLSNNYLHFSLVCIPLLPIYSDSYSSKKKKSKHKHKHKHKHRKDKQKKKHKHKVHSDDTEDETKVWLLIPKSINVFLVQFLNLINNELSCLNRLMKMYPMKWQS